MAVVLRDNETLESAWRRLMKELLASGTIDELKKRSFYIKPSVTKSAIKRQYKKTQRRHSKAVRKSIKNM